MTDVITDAPHVVPDTPEVWAAVTEDQLWDPRLKDIPDHVGCMIITGVTQTPDGPQTGNAAVRGIIHALVQLGRDDQQIRHILTEPDFKISEYVRGKGAGKEPEKAEVAVTSYIMKAIAAHRGLVKAETQIGNFTSISFKQADLKPTPWVVKNHSLRGSVTVIGAAGGTGKTQSTVQCAVAWAHGQACLGFVPMRPLKILFLSGEEPGDEMRRRIAACVIHRGVATEKQFDDEMEKIDGRLFIYDDKDISLVIKDGADGKIEQRALVQKVVKFVREHEIDLVFIDPVARAQRGLDENSAEMTELHAAADEIATSGNCAAVLVHHIRKSSSGGVDDQGAVRGFSGIVDNARVAIVMANMTAMDAKEFLPAEEQPHYTRYLKIGDPKQNYGPNSGTRWFKKRSVTLPVLLEDGTPDCRFVLEPWTPSRGGDVLRAEWLQEFLDMIDAGDGDGNFYTAATNGSRAMRADALLEDRFNFNGGKKGSGQRALQRLIDAGILGVDRDHRSKRGNRNVPIYVVKSRVPVAPDDANIPF